jgi:hypothetical protein
VRSEDFGLTLGYDSGLAAGRTLGAAPTDYQAAPHATHAIPVRGFRLGALTLPDASLSGGTAHQPGLCDPQSIASFGQATPIALRAEIARAGSTTTQSFPMASNNSQADFSGFIDLPVQDGQVAGSGLYPTHVVVTSDALSACVASGGTFGVANVQSAVTQLAVQPGPLATFDYHELVQHRLSSAYGTGWTIQELERVYRAGDVAFLAKGDGSSEKFLPRAYPHYIARPSSGYAITRDSQTGEIFLVRDAGDIQRVDATTGTATTILSGLPFSAGVTGAAVAYVGSARHFAVALSTSLVDVDSGGAATTLTTRAAPPPFHNASVAARGRARLLHRRRERLALPNAPLGLHARRHFGLARERRRHPPLPARCAVGHHLRRPARHGLRVGRDPLSRRRPAQRRVRDQPASER